MQYIKSSVTNLKNYNSNINCLPKDTDGIYILIDGRAKITNPYDANDIKTLHKYDSFGEHKYLLNKEFSYFGDIVAMQHS